MTVIEEARATLKRWREAAPWLGGPVVNGGTPLIDGTAGNPDLLDALDDLLAVGQASKGTNPFAAGYVVYVERIATAIVRADKEMQK